MNYDRLFKQVLVSGVPRFPVVFVGIANVRISNAYLPFVYDVIVV